MTKKSIPYWHVDAFATVPFSGNQAAVMMLDEWPEDSVLQAIGAENNFAETAFLVPDNSDAADYELRWFTPTVEIRLCGHATLASGFIILSQMSELDSGPDCDSKLASDAVRFSTREAGVLTVRRSHAGYEVELPAIPTERGEWVEAAILLGVEANEIWRNTDGYNIFLFEDEATVRALEPDFARLAALGDQQFICTAPGDKVDVVSRVFVPGAGVDEDSVTGSAHGVLTPFWADRLGQDSFTAHQASVRGGDLTCRLAKGLKGETVWLGGGCTLVVEGRFYR